MSYGESTKDLREQYVTGECSADDLLDAIKDRDDENHRLREQLEQARVRIAAVTNLADKLAHGVTLQAQSMTPDEDREADSATFTAHEDYLVYRECNPDTESKAWLLRQKADAVQSVAEHTIRAITDNELNKVADLLRQQATELEKT